MFVVAKAIFSIFAIARQALKQKKFANGPACAMAKFLKIALAATSIAQTSTLSFALLVLWPLDFGQ